MWVASRQRLPIVCVSLYAFLCLLPVSDHAYAQTNCDEGNGLVDFTPPKDLTPQQVIDRFAANESKVKDARARYTYSQDVLVQTLSGTSVDGEFHEVTLVSYDDKGKRLENVTYAAQSTLRRAQLTEEDMDDIRVFMPFVLTTEDLPRYGLIYGGKQHVDDLDTYMFHVEPKKEDKRYFQGRVWVDSQDFQIVKVCGKSGPERRAVKKNQRPDLRPTFVTYRQQVDGNWFPAYTRSDDTLQFRAGAIRIKEIVKYTNYKKALGGVGSASARL
jgi:hypothetical protein